MTTQTKFTVAMVKKAMEILGDNQAIDPRTVYPRRWAKIMRERGTWDDSRMIEEIDPPILAFGRRIT